MSKLSITKRLAGNVAILALSGKVLIGECSINFRTLLRELIQQGETNILLDLAKIS